MADRHVVQRLRRHERLAKRNMVKMAFEMTNKPRANYWLTFNGLAVLGLIGSA